MPVKPPASASWTGPGSAAGRGPRRAAARRPSAASRKVRPPGSPVRAMVEMAVVGAGFGGRDGSVSRSVRPSRRGAGVDRAGHAVNRQRRGAVGRDQRRSGAERHFAARPRRRGGLVEIVDVSGRAGRRPGPGRRAGPGAMRPWSLARRRSAALTLVAAASASAGVKPASVSQPDLAQRRGAVIDAADPGVGADPDADSGRLQPPQILAAGSPSGGPPVGNRLGRPRRPRLLARPFAAVPAAPVRAGRKLRVLPAARRRPSSGRRRCRWPASARSARRRPRASPMPWPSASTPAAAATLAPSSVTVWVTTGMPAAWASSTIARERRQVHAVEVGRRGRSASRRRTP